MALSGTLYEMQDNGEIDLVLTEAAARHDARGRLVYREPLVWLAHAIPIISRAPRHCR